MIKVLDSKGNVKFIVTKDKDGNTILKRPTEIKDEVKENQKSKEEVKEEEKKEEVFVCNICGKEYKTEKGLKKHIEKEHDQEEE